KNCRMRWYSVEGHMRWASSRWLAISASCACATIAIAQVSSQPGPSSKTPSGRFDVQYATQPGFGAEAEPHALGSVVKGNTTIVFEPANPSDIDMQRLQTWDEFASSHPRIASALAYKPSLISDEAYLSKHPELSAFFQAH